MKKSMEKKTECGKIWWSMRGRVQAWKPTKQASKLFCLCQDNACAVRAWDFIGHDGRGPCAKRTVSGCLL